MRTFIPFTAVLLFGSVQAQHLNNVTWAPQNPTSCQQVVLTCIGSLPTSGQLDNQNPVVTGNSISIDLNASGGSGGNVPFNQPLTPLGPFDPGVVTITVTLNYNGGAADVWTGQFTVAQGLIDPDPGEYGSTDVCNTAASLALFSVLEGTPDPGGIWYDPVGDLVPSGQFVPGTSPAGFYVYVFDQLPPCNYAEQQVLISYLPNGNAGQNATTQICAAGVPVDLFGVLAGTPDAGGSWTRPNGSSLPGGVFTPGTDPAGNYTYTVPGQGGCDDPQATVTVQLVQPPNAGTGSSVELCFDDDAEVLNNHVTGEQTTGTWYTPNGFTGGQYNAPINVAGYGEGVYIYVVTGTVCPSDTAFVDVTLNGPPCTIGIDEVGGNISRFDVMPNPASEGVTVVVELGHAASGHVLELLDVDGRTVRSEALAFNGTSSVRTLDVSGLRAGAYVVRLSSPDGHAVRRLMVH
ncbi:MAG: T9SS type A sorting domain-containing protein [Bacteroidetes bacterium]|nr:T9SS type A sorting domain-containing protein [Bacteroidota bacterium]